MREGWEEVKFGDVVQFPPKIKLKKGLPYPFIPMENLDSGIKYVKPLIEKKIKGSGAKFEEGDTLFSRITPCLQNGKIAQAKDLKGKPGFGSTEYFVFREIKELTHSDFIYYLSKSQWFKGNAENSMVGSSGRQRADADFLRNLKINLPPLNTQRKIASILSAYDDLIENNLKRIKLLEEQAQLTYEEWFVRLKFPGHEDVAIDKATGLPVGWEIKKLEKVLKASNGKSFKSDFLNYNEIPVYGSNGIIGQSEIYNNEKAIIVGRVGAYCGATKYCKSKFWATDNTITLTSTDERMPNELAFYIIKLYDLRNLAGGSAQPLLTQRLINNLDLTIPKRNISLKFTELTNRVFDTIINLKNQNQLLKEARDILLPRLMSGMVDVDELLGDSKYVVNTVEGLRMVAEDRVEYKN